MAQTSLWVGREASDTRPLRRRVVERLTDVDYVSPNRVSARCPLCQGFMLVEFIGDVRVAFRCRSGCDHTSVWELVVERRQAPDAELLEARAQAEHWRSEAARWRGFAERVVDRYRRSLATPADDLELAA